MKTLIASALLATAALAAPGAPSVGGDIFDRIRAESAEGE